MTLRSEVANMLLKFRRTLRGGPPTVEREDVDLWVTLFERAGIDPVDVEPAYHEYMVDGEFFPAPASIISLARKHGATRNAGQNQGGWNLRQVVEPINLDDPDQRAKFELVRQRIRSLSERKTLNDV